MHVWTRRKYILGIMSIYALRVVRKKQIPSPLYPSICRHLSSRFLALETHAVPAGGKNKLRRLNTVRYGPRTWQKTIVCLLTMQGKHNLKKKQIAGALHPRVSPVLRLQQIPRPCPPTPIKIGFPGRKLHCFGSVSQWVGLLGGPGIGPCKKKAKKLDSLFQGFFSGFFPTFSYSKSYLLNSYLLCDYLPNI